MKNLKSAFIKQFFTPLFVMNKNMFSHTILMYHGVSEKKSNYNKRHQPKKDFIKHLQFLKKYCHVIPLDDYFNQKFREGKINVALTFDDGYWNNYSIAKPLLEEFNLPAHFFFTGINENNNLNTPIPPILWADFIEIASKLKLTPNKNEYIDLELVNQEYIDKKTGKSIHHFIKNIRPEFSVKKDLYNLFSENQQKQIFNQPFEYWKLMNEKEIISTANSKLISVGSHGYFHNNIGKLSVNDMHQEISNSKNYLENLTQKPIDSIAYPDGSYSTESKNYCFEIGIKYQLATDNYIFEDDEIDPRILNRSGIYDVGHFNNQLYNALKKK